MRCLRYLVIAVCLLSTAAAFGQKEDWLPITPQDQQFKDVPGEAGASAIQLYYADYIDDTEQTEFFYQRIKILRPEGNKYADVEIEIPRDTSLSGLKARTIHPDGKIIEFTGKAFEKTLIKGRGIKIVARTFTMPEVTPGSIIEYKYKVSWPYILGENFWTIQHNLYTVRENFSMKPYEGLLDGFPDGFQVSVIYARMPKDLKPQRKGSGFELSAENIPAFQAEGYMPPEDDYKPQVRFFYLGRNASTTEKFWQDAGRSWHDEIEHYIGNHKEVAQAAAQAIGTETDPEKKLRALYARAQQVRNLSYERERTQQEQKKEKIKDIGNSGDVLARGYGYRNDVTRLFVAMARASGFDASVLPVSNRRDRLFDRGLLSRRQLDAEIAMVNSGGKQYYLDPGTKFCPFGLMRWFYTSTSALKLDKKDSAFLMVPPATQDKAVVRRTAQMKLDAGGTLKGKITLQATGEDALEYRLDALDTDEAGRKKELEDELSALLMNGAKVNLVSVGDWTAVEAPLTAVFDVEIPGFASVAGKRLLVPSYLFATRQLDAFKHADRKYPVYFSYAYAELDNLTFDLPPDYTVESTPQMQDVNVPYARYRSVSQMQGHTLNTQRALLFNAIFFPVDQYSGVKEFFNKVQAGDELQVVLKGASVSAQKAD